MDASRGNEARARAQGRPEAGKADSLLFVTVTHPKQLKTRGAISQVRSHVRGTRRPSIRNPVARQAALPYGGTVMVEARTKDGRTAKRAAQVDGEGSESLDKADAETLRDAEQRLRIEELEAWARVKFDPEELCFLRAFPRLVGSTIDPFGSLPSFKNPKIDVLWLAWTELRYHSIPGMEYVQSSEHIDSAIASSQAWLSTLSIAAPIQDILQELHGESETTMLVRSEAHGMINEGLRGTNPLSNELTWMLIRLVVWEGLNANFATVQLHLQGLEALVNRRGGLYQIADHDASLALTIEALFLACVHEQRAKPSYMEFSMSGCFSAAARRNPATTPTSPIHAISEQPLQLRGCWCPPRTLHILTSARILTQLLLERGDANTESSSVATTPEARTEALVDHYLARRLYEDLLNQPSAKKHDSPMANDWVYEACRIAAVLYATALVFKIPISAAFSHPHVSIHAPCPLASLGEAMKFSDSYSFWGDTLFGPLLWVALVASIAPEPEVGASEPRDSHVARKWCRLVLSRCKVKSWVDGTMDATLDAIRTLLEVQSILTG